VKSIDCQLTIVQNVTRQAGWAAAAGLEQAAAAAAAVAAELQNRRGRIRCHEMNACIRAGSFVALPAISWIGSIDGS
jgi:hypothetical protein